MTEGSVSGGRLGVLSTISDSLKIWPKSIGPQIILALITLLTACVFLVFAVPVSLISRYILEENPNLSGSEIAKYIIYGASIVFLYILFLFIVIKINISQYLIVNNIYNNKQYKIIDSIFTKDPNIFAYIALYLMVIIPISIGIYALLIPGIILSINLSQSLIVMIIEKAWIGASLDRSWLLTRGNRWRIFALWMIFVPVLMLAIGLAIGGANLIEHGKSGAGLALMFLYIISLLAIGSFSIPLQVVTYHKLRALKDGAAEASDPQPSGAA